MSSASDLKFKRCVPCGGGEPPLDRAAIDRLLAQVPLWRYVETPRLIRTFRFRDFKEAMGFVNRMADLAEAEGHHPDFFVRWNEVRVELWTHATGGLHENDFVLAAKIDALVPEPSGRRQAGRYKEGWERPTG
jgi:4a-hydroxytetrahydrobiopterin dehydratase